MNAPAFSDAVRRALLAAGWFAGRSVDTAPAQLAHDARGLSWHREAARFLASFGGLTLLGARGDRVAAFDPLAALARLSGEQARTTETWMGESFCVLGVVHAGDKLLLMSDRGALYGAGEHVLVAYGTELTELFERLCSTHGVPNRALN